MKAGVLLLFLCFASAGCGLVPVPYATEVTGTVRGIRVLDAATESDIPNAQATLTSGMGMTNWVGTRPPQVMILPPDSAESKGILAGRGLKRRDDQTFAVPRYLVLGLVGRGYWRQQPPVATLTATAPGYPHAMLEYCSSRPPEAGFSDSRSLAGDWTPSDPAMPGTAPEPEGQLVRCELQKDGMLRFYLQRLTPEMVEAIRTPGRSVARREPRREAEFVGYQPPQDAALQNDAGGPDCLSIGVPQGTRGARIDRKTSCGCAAPIAELSGPPVQTDSPPVFSAPAMSPW